MRFCPSSQLTLCATFLALGVATAIGQATGTDVRMVGQAGWSCRTVDVQGTFAYVGEGDGLAVYDISRPTSLPRVGSINLGGIPGEVCVCDLRAFIGIWHVGLCIIDVTNPSSPILQGKYSMSEWPLGVFVEGNLAYVTRHLSMVGPETGLLIIDVSTPSAPTLMSFCDTPGLAIRVHVTGGFAYVADSLAGLQIIDVTNPSAPTIVGSLDTPGAAQDVYVSNGLACVTDGYGSGLLIVDVTNPTAPRLVASYDTPGMPLSVYVANGLAYVADGYCTEGPSRPGSFQIIDVATPSNPELRGSYYMPGNNTGLSLSGGVICVAAEGGGLYALQYTAEAPRIERAALTDRNANETVDAGDRLTLTLTRNVRLTTAVQASHFALPVASDSLGGSGFAACLNPRTSRQLILIMGENAHLTPGGSFSMSDRTPGSPSGIDFSADLPFGAVVSYTGISAIDGGELGVNDSAVDIEQIAAGTSTWHLYP